MDSSVSEKWEGELEKTYVVLCNIDSRPLLDDVGVDLYDSTLTGFAECLAAHQVRRHLITKRIRNGVNDRGVCWLCGQANANIRSV